MTEDTVAVGRVISAFGLRGEVTLTPLSRFPERFYHLERVLVGEERVAFTVESVREHSGAILLKLTGIDTPEAARRLVRQYLYVPESEAVALPPGEFFVWQLVGLRVRTAAGEELGRLAEVLPTGSNDVYVVHGHRGEVLIPALKDVVKDVDLASGTMSVELPPGLIEE